MLGLLNFGQQLCYVCVILRSVGLKLIAAITFSTHNSIEKGRGMNGL